MTDRNPIVRSVAQPTMRGLLRADAWSGEGTWVRDGDTYRPWTDDDGIRLARAFEAAGRAHLRPGGSP